MQQFPDKFYEAMETYKLGSQRSMTNIRNSKHIVIGRLTCANFTVYLIEADRDKDLCWGWLSSGHGFEAKEFPFSSLLSYFDKETNETFSLDTRIPPGRHCLGEAMDITGDRMDS